MRSLARRLGLLERAASGVFTRQRFESTREAWAELKWRALESIGVPPATCAHLMAIHEQGVAEALARTPFPLLGDEAMRAFIETCEVDWDAALAQCLSAEQNARYVDQIWDLHAALVAAGETVEALTAAWARRRARPQ